MISTRIIAIIGEIFLLISGVVGLTIAVPEMIYYAPPLVIIIFTIGMLTSIMATSLLIWRMS